MKNYTFIHAEGVNKMSINEAVQNSLSLIKLALTISLLFYIYGCATHQTAKNFNMDQKIKVVYTDGDTPAMLIENEKGQKTIYH